MTSDEIIALITQCRHTPQGSCDEILSLYAEHLSKIAPSLKDDDLYILIVLVAAIYKQVPRQP